MSHGNASGTVHESGVVLSKFAAGAFFFENGDETMS